MKSYLAAQMSKVKSMFDKQDSDGVCRCPLMGAAVAVGKLQEAYALIIGTEECSYYTKSTLRNKGLDEQCFSVVLDNHDVTFGSIEKVSIALRELIEEYNPSSIYLITTCVVEIVGDDFTALIEECQEKYQVSIKLIQTNHFTGKNHHDGFNQVMNASS